MPSYVSPSYSTSYVWYQQVRQLTLTCRASIRGNTLGKLSPPTPAQTIIKHSSSVSLHFIVQREKKSDTLEKTPKRFRFIVTQKTKRNREKRAERSKVTINIRQWGCRTKRWRFCFSLFQVSWLMFNVLFGLVWKMFLNSLETKKSY